MTEYHIINPHTGTVLIAGHIEACGVYLREHWELFEQDKIDLVYASTGHAASFVINDDLIEDVAPC